MAEIEERLNALRSPFRTAETFWVEEIIDPRDTRPLLCEFASLAEPLLTPGLRTFGMRPLLSADAYGPRQGTPSARLRRAGSRHAGCGFHSAVFDR